MEKPHFIPKLKVGESRIKCSSSCLQFYENVIVENLDELVLTFTGMQLLNRRDDFPIFFFVVSAPWET